MGDQTEQGGARVFCVRSRPGPTTPSSCTVGLKVPGPPRLLPEAKKTGGFFNTVQLGLGLMGMILLAVSN
jgi:hypothetical protein